MAIDKKLIHFKSKDNFMSANGVNGSIDSPSSGSEENGNAEYGQVKGTSIAFVKDSKEIWTHGNLYKSVNWSTLGEDDNTTDGYHAELQDKTVEITENGQVEVSADAGYYGLNRVSIKTNVPQSGGGTEGGESHAEYYSIDWEKAKELGYDENDTSVISYTGNFTLLLGMSQTACFYKAAIMTTAAIIKTDYLKPSWVDRVQYRFPIITTDLDGNSVECNTLNEIVTKRVDNINEIIIDGIFAPITKEQFYTI